MANQMGSQHRRRPWQPFPRRRSSAALQARRYNNNSLAATCDGTSRLKQIITATTTVRLPATELHLSSIQLRLAWIFAGTNTRKQVGRSQATSAAANFIRSDLKTRDEIRIYPACISCWRIRSQSFSHGMHQRRRLESSVMPSRHDLHHHAS